MRRFSEKLLVLLLTLLLGLSPLQGAMAGFAPSFGQEEGVHQMVDQYDGGQAMAADPVAVQDCEQCNAETGCNGQDCSSGHCVSCTLAVLPLFSIPTNHSTASVLIQTDSGYISQRSSSPFRPPRA